MNALKTTMLMAIMTALLMAMGYYIGEYTGGSGTDWAIIAFAVAGIMNFIMFWFSDRIVLKMYKAQEVDRADSPQLYDTVARLADKANMPMPRVYVIPTNNPNAFATGRSPSKAAVAATYGILKMLSMEELEGVMAHELAHVKHRDTLISTIAATMGGAISFLARIFWESQLRTRSRSKDSGKAQIIGALIMVVLAPIVAALIQMAVSRSREYAADAAGARMCGRPEALASALHKLQMGVAATPMEDMGSAATANMFIVNPFKAGFIENLFSTHPPMEERISRLRNMRL